MRSFYFAKYIIKKYAMEKLPIYVNIAFALITAITVLFFYIATNHSKAVLMIILLWLALQSVVALSGFYTVTSTVPPRFLLLVLPPLALIIILFFTRGGRRFIDSSNIKILTVLHTIRLPIELVLVWLFVNKTIPEIMTFQGRNFDILSGITAPLVYYFGFVKRRLKTKIILAWNFICLLLLINIVAIAILSAPFPFEKFGFGQPNIALLYFPFVWLPSCIVPVVLFSHLAAIRQLLKAESSKFVLE